MGGPPPPALLRIQPHRRNFVKGPSVPCKTGLSSKALSNARDELLPSPADTMIAQTPSP